MLPACAHGRLERRCQHAEYNIPTTSGCCFDLTGSERHNASLMKNRKNENAQSGTGLECPARLELNEKQRRS